MSVSIQRLYSAPEGHMGGEEIRKQFRKLTRDSTGRIWALGDGQVLCSANGVEWTDFSANLKSEGSFTVDSVAISENTVYLFARNRHGLCVYRRDDYDTSWSRVSS